jgi:hypothetical protein
MAAPYSTLRSRLGTPTKTVRGIAGEALADGNYVYKADDGKWYVIAQADAEGLVTSTTIASGSTGNIRTYGGFNDTEIESIWELVAGAANDTEREQAALAEMAYRLRNNAAKLHNYSAGQSSQQLAQVFQHLDLLYQELKPYLDKALGIRTRQLSVGRVLAPARNHQREMPDERGLDSEGYRPNG